MIQAARLAEATRIFAVIPPLQMKASEYEDGAFANAKSRRGNIAQVCLTAGIDLIDVTPHRLEDKTKEDYKLWARRIADTIRSEYPNPTVVKPIKLTSGGCFGLEDDSEEKVDKK